MSGPHQVTFSAQPKDDEDGVGWVDEDGDGGDDTPVRPASSFFLSPAAAAAQGRRSLGTAPAGLLQGRLSLGGRPSVDRAGRK